MPLEAHVVTQARGGIVVEPDQLLEAVAERGLTGRAVGIPQRAAHPLLGGGFVEIVPRVMASA